MSDSALLAAVAGIAASLAVRDLCGEAVARMGEWLRLGDRRLVPAGIRARVATSGRPTWLGSRQWLALKTLCAAVVAALALAAAASSPSRVMLLLAIAAPAAAFYAPDVYVARRQHERIREAVRDLPDMVDLLRVAVEAGMAPTRALGVVAAQFSGPLAAEWRRGAAEVALGAPAQEALTSLSERLPSAEVGSLVEALIRAHRHGAPLRHLLAVQASRARHRRRQQVREQAARAGPTIQLVVALLLVPSVLLLVAAGILAELQRSGLWLAS